MSALLEVQDLVLRYRRRDGGRVVGHVTAVDHASFSVGAGRTVGLVGESGSGKTSIAMAVLGLLDVAAGSIVVDEWDVAAMATRVPADYRRAVQVVWQDPASSLTPRMTIGALLAELLEVHHGLRGAAARDRCAELLDQVGLPDRVLTRLPHQLSGGQRQRIAIARALAPGPRLIVLDEPVSALDVLTQSQVLCLLEEVQAATGVAYLLISHDIGVVRYLAQSVVVLHDGCVKESGPVDQVCDEPVDSYTRTLLGAVLEPPANT